MASVTETKLVCDISGEKADETITFGLDGTVYDIDLTRDLAGELRDELARYLAKARRTGKLGAAAVARKPGRSAGAESTGAAIARAGREQTQAVREWARNHGLTVSDRGRISAQVQTAFDEAHRGSQLSAVG